MLVRVRMMTAKVGVRNDVRSAWRLDQDENMNRRPPHPRWIGRWLAVIASRCVVSVRNVAVVSTAIVATLALAFLISGRRPGVPEIPDGVSQAEYLRVAADMKRRLHRDPTSGDIHFELGQRLMDRKEWATAVSCFRGIPVSHPRCGQAAKYLLGQTLLQQDRLRDAESSLVEFVAAAAAAPQSLVVRDDVIAARHYLSYLLAIELRFEERSRLIRDMHSRGETEAFDILVLYFPSLLEWNVPHGRERIESALRIDPQDFGFRVALGRYLTGLGRLDEADSVLAECHAERPADLLAIAARAACLIERNDWPTAHQLVDSIGANREEEEPWLLLRLRGQILLNSGDFTSAAAAFRRALAADPTSAESHVGLANAYRGLSNDRQRDEALRKVQGLARIQNRVGHFAQEPAEWITLIEIAEICESIDFIKAAESLTEFVSGHAPTHPRLTALQRRLGAGKSDHSGQVP